MVYLMYYGKNEWCLVHKNTISFPFFLYLCPEKEHENKID